LNIFEVDGVSVKIDDKLILKNITFSVKMGTMFGIIGPNGSGKSTLLRALTGILPVFNGRIFFKDKELKSYSRKEIARQIAVVEQEGTPPLAYTVEDVVAMGRYPWLNAFSSPLERDRQVIEDILASLNLKSLCHRPLSALSGGERQRVSLARALAQEPEVLILDEPTTYLDIGNQLQVMEYIRHWHQIHQLTVIMVLHDLNLTSQYCEEILLLNEGQVHTWGPSTNVLNVANIEEVYHTSLLTIEHPTLGVPQFLLASN